MNIPEGDQALLLDRDGDLWLGVPGRGMLQWQCYEARPIVACPRAASGSVRFSLQGYRDALITHDVSL